MYLWSSTKFIFNVFNALHNTEILSASIISDNEEASSVSISRIDINDEIGESF